MAVEQVSQIQVRSGLIQDLGRLARGEFGWAIDELRLYIGNGLIIEGAPEEGNTEIITRPTLLRILGGTDDSGMLPNFLYRFKGVEGGYEAQTGPDPISPIRRRIQEKLDDNVNIKDFGALGNGIANDLDAIQRAIDQIYDRYSLYTSEETRRIINFHPGIYNIYGELRIPPYVTLRGAGRDGVIIRQMSFAAPGIFKTTNSRGAYDQTMLEGGLQPGPIEFQNITFEMKSSAYKYVGLIDSASHVNFYKCRFVGPYVKPLYQDYGACIKITSVYYPATDYYFSDCDFIGMANGIVIQADETIQDIVIDGCLFKDLFQGIEVLSNIAPLQMGMRLTNNYFDDIKERGVFVRDDIEGVTSTTNTFLNVGYHYAANIALERANIAPVTSYITFSGNSCYSFGDLFLSRYDTDFDTPAVEHGAEDIISLDTANSMRFGSTYQTIGRSIILYRLSDNYIPLPGRYMSGVINYVLERFDYHRSGYIYFSIDPVSNVVHFRDNFIQNKPVNIDIRLEHLMLTPHYNGRKPVIIVYSDLDDEYATIFTYDVKSQDSKNFIDPTVTRPRFGGNITTTTTSTSTSTSTTSTSTSTTSTSTSTSTTTTSTSTTTTTSTSTTTSTTTLSWTFGRTYAVTRYNTTNYLINGSTNLDLYFTKRYKYVFNIDAVGFPFAIKSALTSGNSDLWTEGVTNNVTDYGSVEFIVPLSAPTRLYYVAINDPDMYGNIFILDTTTTSTTLGPSTTTTSTTAAPPPLNFDISYSCDSGLGTIQMSNFTGGTGTYEIAGRILTGWYTTQAEAENPALWYPFAGPYSRSGLPSGTYWMALRDAGNVTAILSKSIVVSC
jgi:Pectate lyase superfamily protein